MSGPARNPFASNTELLKGEKKEAYLQELGIKPKKKPIIIPTTDDETDDELGEAGIAGIGSSRASTGGGGYGKKRVAEDSRGQANLTGKRRSSLLTS